MKTFLILFAIAVSLPTEAQRVRENVKQRVEIVENNSQVIEDEVEEVKVQAPKEKGKEKVEKTVDALRKR